MADVELVTTTGVRARVGSGAIARFDAELRGEILQPGDATYDEARKVWNGMVDKRPALIARCAGTADVVAAVRFAREHDALASVRGGGHNYAGKAVCDGGLMIDLSLMKGLHVDPNQRTARAEAGLRLGEFDRETQKFGLATTLGVNTDTGIAGLTLGGGYGWLAGKYGLACDNVISAEVVTASGRAIRVNAEEYPELFWAIRGAGANFGIVTVFEYQLHPVHTVVGGMVIHPFGRDVVRFFDEFSSTAPDELSTAGVVLTGADGKPAFATVVCYCGAPEKAERVLQPLRSFTTPLADLIAARPYVEMQGLLDAAWPPGRLYYSKAHNVPRLSEAAIDTIVEYTERLPTAVSNIALQQLHGVAARVPENETAFPHRYEHYNLLVHPATDDPAASQKMIAWAQECWEALRPHAAPGVYVNALDESAEDGQQRLRDAYGSNYERLAQLKAEYDPTNFFRLNQNITPATRV